MQIFPGFRPGPRWRSLCSAPLSALGLRPKISGLKSAPLRQIPGYAYGTGQGKESLEGAAAANQQDALHRAAKMLRNT